MCALTSLLVHAEPPAAHSPCWPHAAASPTRVRAARGAQLLDTPSWNLAVVVQRLVTLSRVWRSLLQPKYIPRFIARQAERDADVVTGSRYIRGGGVAGWDTRRKLTSCGANILAATLLQPRVCARLLHSVC